MTVSNKSNQGKEQEGGGKIEKKLFEVNIMAVSGGQNELIPKFKVVVPEREEWKGNRVF